MLVGWLCFTSHRHRGHLETAPLFTAPCNVQLQCYRASKSRQTKRICIITYIKIINTCTIVRFWNYLSKWDAKQFMYFHIFHLLRKCTIEITENQIWFLIRACVRARVCACATRSHKTHDKSGIKKDELHRCCCRPISCVNFDEKWTLCATYTKGTE